MDARECGNERQRFGLLAVIQKVRVYNIIRVLNRILKYMIIKLYGFIVLNYIYL